MRGGGIVFLSLHEDNPSVTFGDSSLYTREPFTAAVRDKVQTIFVGGDVPDAPPQKDSQKQKIPLGKPRGKVLFH